MLFNSINSEMWEIVRTMPTADSCFASFAI